MACLFSGRVLIRNNSDQDELDTEAELSRRLENRLVLLFFGAGSCPKCQAFAPILRDFFVRLTDEFYVLRAAQLALVYVSQDSTEEQQDLFLRDMPKKWLFLPFEDDLKRDLGRRFSVERLPAVVVLKPNGDVLTLDAADEIRRLGPACFANWQEASEVLDRSFLLPEDLDDPAPRSLTEPLRRRKYRVDPASRGVRGRGRGGDPGQEGGAEGGSVGLF
ncbi:nucleoredoxin-like protein 1 [Sagmatias obliquidens]|uniref:nucleoredoxin-like protein 1 n=1 Tax=Sagmatias obliquidens TaxID=3371155 RepID=UPI000F441275|nr:nucleoredoxin-like protein 1 [Lagenorhynchus obliquidens]